MKTCSVCQTSFTPGTSMQSTCSLTCAKEQKILNSRNKKTKPKKPQVKLSTLQAKADALMSEYIRRKHADEHGYVTCVSCGRSFRWQDVDNGHFISRRHFATRYIEENCHPECKGCNRFNHDHLIGYTQSMIDLYGKDGIKWLQEESRKLLSPSQKRQLVTEAIEYYGGKLEEMNGLQP